MNLVCLPSREACVAVEISLAASLVLSTFDKPTVLFVTPAMVPDRDGLTMLAPPRRFTKPLALTTPESSRLLEGAAWIFFTVKLVPV